MSVLEQLDYTEEKGKDIGHQLTVYALSTCGFCRNALKFLRENQIQFKFVYMDKIDFDLKQKVKEALEKKYDKRVVFPYLVIDELSVVVGYTEEEWKESLGV